MILTSDGRYTSTYDEEQNQVFMCLLSKEMKLFADSLTGEDSAFVVVQLNSGNVQASDKDKQAIIDFLINDEINMDADAFLRGWANIEFLHNTLKPIKCNDNWLTLRTFENEMKMLNTEQEWLTHIERRLA